MEVIRYSISEVFFLFILLSGFGKMLMRQHCLWAHIFAFSTLIHSIYISSTFNSPPWPSTTLHELHMTFFNSSTRLPKLIPISRHRRRSPQSSDTRLLAAIIVIPVSIQQTMHIYYCTRPYRCVSHCRMLSWRYHASDRIRRSRTKDLIG
jgi:hypothetical protein